MSNPLLQCKQLCKSYKENGIETDVLKGVDLEVLPGEILAIVGTSGSGKSTLLHLLGALDVPTSGEVLIEGEAIHRMSEAAKNKLRNQKLGFVYQFHHLLPEFSALENVAMPLLIGGERAKNAKQLAAEMIDNVGLSHRIKHKPSELSGGERQRIAIARALVNSPRLVMADEPTGNLDAQSAEEIFQLMRDLNQRLKTGFVVVTHDLELAARMDRQVRLVKGQLEELAEGALA